MPAGRRNQTVTALHCISLESVAFCIQGLDHPIVDDISFTVAEGERLTLLGPSGSGKSTILRLIVRLEERTTGAIHAGPDLIDDLPVRDLRRRIALVPQEPSLLGLTVRGNLDLAAELSGVAATTSYEELLSRVDLPVDLLDRNGRELSVGQKQRVTLARALIGRPQALLLDEPTSALDPGLQAGIAGLLNRLADDLGTAILTVTHSPQLAASLGGRGIFLRRGRIEDAGEMQQLLSRDGGSVVAQFLNGELRESS